MKLKRYLSTYLLIQCFVLCVLGQDQAKEKAAHAFRHGDYHEAIRYYEQYNEISEDRTALGNRGIAYYKTNALKNAISDFTDSKRLGNKDKSLFWYMAQCHQHMANWTEACYFYTQYISESKENDPFHFRAKVELKNCLYNIDNGSTSLFDSYVQSFGDSVNSIRDEISPTRSPLFGNLYYYSSNLNGGFEIKAVQLNRDGSWDREPLDQRVFNTSGDNIIQDIDGSGQSLLLRTDRTDRKEPRYALSIMDTLGNEKLYEIPVKLFKSIDDIQIVDANTIAFASNKLGGYGGYDIFTMSFNNGEWAKAQNAGPQINSAYNERSPYMSSGQEAMFFSSDKPYCHGGYDIYYINLESDKKVPVNLGPSINSTADDLYFKIDEDGQVAIFTSNRPDGPGAFDLYFAYMKDLIDWQARSSDSFAYSSTFKSQLPRTHIPAQVSEESTIADTTEVIFEPEPEVSIEYDHAYSIFYEDSYDLFNATNTAKLNGLAKEVIDDNKKLLLVAHTDQLEPGLEEYILYNTFKRGLKLAERLQELGVDSSKIAIEGTANNYPAVLSNAAAPDSIIRFNKRIDLIIIDPNNPEDNIRTNVEDAIADHLLNKRFVLYDLITDGLYFSIRIASNERMVKNAILRLYNDVFIRKESLNSKNDYYVGLYTNIDDALELYEKLKENSSLEPEIKVFYKKQLLSSKQIERMSRRFRSLKKLPG